MKTIQNPREKSVILNEIINELNKNAINFILDKDLCNLFVEYFMSDLNINKAEFEYDKLDKGVSSQVSETSGIITLSTRMFIPTKQLDLLTSIGHELYHIYQNKNTKRNKTTNQDIKQMYPLQKCTLDAYQEYFEKKTIDTNAYYHTAQNEKQARDFANKSIVELLQEIKLNKNSSRKVVKWCTRKIRKMQKLIKKEEKLYNKNLVKVASTCGKLKDIIYEKVDNAIKTSQIKYETLNTVVGNDRMFEKYLYYYCDNLLTSKIINFAVKANDIQTLLMCINHPNTEIKEQDFFKMLSVYSPLEKVKDTFTLSEKLNNWDPAKITKLCLEYNKTIPAKKYQHAKNLKIQQQENLAEKETTTTQTKTDNENIL